MGLIIFITPFRIADCKPLPLRRRKRRSRLLRQLCRAKKHPRSHPRPKASTPTRHTAKIEGGDATGRVRSGRFGSDARRRRPIQSSADRWRPKYRELCNCQQVKPRKSEVFRNKRPKRCAGAARTASFTSTTAVERRPKCATLRLLATAPDSCAPPVQGVSRQEAAGPYQRRHRTRQTRERASLPAGSKSSPGLQ